MEITVGTISCCDNASALAFDRHMRSGRKIHRLVNGAVGSSSDRFDQSIKESDQLDEQTASYRKVFPHTVIVWPFGALMLLRGQLPDTIKPDKLR